jgi:hypothetical protein
MEKNKTHIVKAIFTNLLFVVGIILMVIGFVRGTSTIAKLAFFKVYPLESYEESRCEMNYYAPAMVKEDGTPQTETPEAKAEREKQIDRCHQEVERGRDVKKVEDVVSSISFFVAGTALALVFKQFIFKKE